MLSFVFVFVLMTFASSVHGQKCYRSDGTSLDDTYAPCNPGSVHSSCCAINRTSGSPDICLDSGLCMQTNNEFMGTLWQTGCTDPTGQHSACAKLCPQSTSSTSSSWNLQMCDFGKYCCRAAGDQGSCCNSASTPELNITSIGVLQLPSPAASTSSQSSPVTTTSSSLLSTSTQAALNDGACQMERQNTIIVGSVLGSIFGLTTLLSTSLILWIHKKERRQRKLKDHYEAQFHKTNAYRKILASTAESIRDSLASEDMSLKSEGHE